MNNILEMMQMAGCIGKGLKTVRAVNGCAGKMFVAKEAERKK